MSTGRDDDIESGYFLTFEKNQIAMSNKSSAKKKGKKADPFLTEEERDESVRLAAYYCRRCSLSMGFKGLQWKC